MSCCHYKRVAGVFLLAWRRGCPNKFWRILMKKLFALILALSMVFTLAACGGEEDSDKDNDESGVVTLENSEPVNGNNDADGNKPTENTTGNKKWEDLYNAYTDGQSAGYNALQDAIDNSGDMAVLTYSMSLVTMISGDLDLAMTGAFFSADEFATKTGLKILYGDSIDYSEVGDTAKLVYTNNDGVKCTYTLKYDGKDTAVITSSTDAGDYSVTSVCVEDDFVAKTYYNKKTTKAVQVISYTNGDVGFCWNDEVDSEPEDLYQNADLAKKSGFGSDMPNRISLIDGVLDGSVDSGSSLFGF